MMQGTWQYMVLVAWDASYGQIIWMAGADCKDSVRILPVSDCSKSSSLPTEDRGFVVARSREQTSHYVKGANGYSPNTVLSLCS